MFAFIRKLAFVSLLALPGITMAADANLYEQTGFQPRLLDASLPLEERTQAFAQVMALANAGHVHAQSLAGTLYWKGPAVAGSSVPQDLAQARALLANAATHGDVTSMSRMAELELEAQQLQAAMVWAQLFTHYLDPERSAREAHGMMYAYSSDLISRIIKAGGKIDEGVSNSVNSMVARYDTSIRDGIDTLRKRMRDGNPRMIAGAMRPRLQGDDTKLSGFADFIVGYDAKGEPKQVWLLNSVPVARVAELTRAGMDFSRVNGDSDNSGMRYMPVTLRLFGKKTRELRPHR